MGKQRLDKIISSQFNISRSEARSSIRKGQVCVDGSAVKDFGILINPQVQSVSLNGQALEFKEHIYVMLNKPKGVLSASSDKSRKTVVDLLPPELSRNGLFPVGRLDKDTTGLIIITDDGDFAHNVISPKKEVNKTYIATLDGEVTDDMCERFAEGITLADGTKCRKAKLQPLSERQAKITIYEGKYHQIKRMFGTVGLGVNELHRISVGRLNLPEDLECGKCVELNNNQIKLVFLEE